MLTRNISTQTLLDAIMRANTKEYVYIDSNIDYNSIVMTSLCLYQKHITHDIHLLIFSYFHINHPIMKILSFSPETASKRIFSYLIKRSNSDIVFFRMKDNNKIRYYYGYESIYMQGCHECTSDEYQKKLKYGTIY